MRSVLWLGLALVVASAAGCCCMDGMPADACCDSAVVAPMSMELDGVVQHAERLDLTPCE